MRTIAISCMLASGLILLPHPTFAACTYRCQPYCLWECTAAAYYDGDGGQAAHPRPGAADRRQLLQRAMHAAASRFHRPDL